MSLGSDFSGDEELVTYFMEYLETAHSEMKISIDILPNTENPEPILASLYSHAHNLKGMAFSFGYHLLTNVTSSLCHYLKHRGTTLNIEIVISHVKAIDAIATHKINGDGGEKGAALLTQLRGDVQNALPATKAIQPWSLIETQPWFLIETWSLALLNLAVALQKDVALLSVLGVRDAVREAQIYTARTFNYSTLIAAALLFLAATVPMARLTDYVTTKDRERRLQRTA